jgi:DDRGK domain-containing protein 1
VQREREERKEKEKVEEEKRKKQDEFEKALEKEQEEREKRLREEQEKREHEEYLKLKQEFVIEEEGQDESLSEENEQNLLQKFIEFIKKSKVVILEDLAAEFKLKTQVIKLFIHQIIIKVTFKGCYKSN